MARDATRSRDGREDGEKTTPTIMSEKAAVEVTAAPPMSPGADSAVDNEKLVEESPNLFLVRGADGADELVTAEDPRLADIPEYVRKVVSFTDDSTLPTLTFRYFLLSLIFIVPGAFLSQLNSFRTTSAPYSVFFVQIASNYVGVWLARILPAWDVGVPGTRFKFNLNPGPFSVKEHVLVTISAASGATGNLGTTPVAMAELYFGDRLNPAVAIFFMWAIVWTGYSFAALSRQFLIYDPQFPWFQSICQAALFETQKKEREHPTPRSRKTMLVFWLVLGGVTLWQFLPEFVWPMLGSLAFLCWVAPNNPTANFIGAGFGGMGMLNLSLDWSAIASNFSLFLTPWWTQVIVFTGFVTSAWVLIPAAKFGHLGSWNLHLMSNRLYMENGTAYPLTSLLTSYTADPQFNETAYAEHGPIFVGTHFLWTIFFDYASYTSALTWMVLFGYPRIKESVSKFITRTRDRNSSGEIADQYDDQLSILQRSYKEVPLWWFFTLFGCSFVVLVTLIALNKLYIPIWTYFVAIGMGLVIVIPLGYLYAISNFQLAIGTTNELIYGLMVNSITGYKNPIGASTYSSIAGNAWYRAQLYLQDVKIGHYMHIPPRHVFFSQVFGSFIGVPINYGVTRWVLNTKSEFLSGQADDPTHQWTGQSLASYLTMGVQYVLIGPKRLFDEPMFRPLPYGFLLGALAPIVVFAAHRAFPRAKFHLWNTTIFFSVMSGFWGNVSTGVVSCFIGGFVVMFWAYRYRHDLWTRWNYILAAAFDAGFNLNLLLLFLCFGAGKIITMPHWWGNDELSSERCFALE